MPDLKLVVTAQIPEGPALSIVDTMTLEGYGQTTILLPHASGAVKIRLASDTLDLLMITSEKYSTSTAQIMMETGTGAGKRVVELTKPLILLGGSIALLGDHKGEITLKNAGTLVTHDTTITVLSAGDVTPP